MSPLLLQFLAETRECLERIGAQLLALETHPDDEGVINELFRFVHTLKGNAGLFEFRNLTRVLHAGEDLLDAVRDGRVGFSGEMADQLFECMDLVAQLADGVEQNGSEPDGCETTAVELAARLRAFLGQSVHADAATGAAATAAAALTEAVVDVPDRLRAALSRIPDADRQDAWECVASGSATLLHVRYEPESDCFYKGEDPFHQILQIPDLLALDIDSREAWSAPEVVDAYRCVLRFDALTLGKRADVDELFRYVPEQVVCRELPSAVLAPQSAAVAESDASTQSSGAERPLPQPDLALWEEIWETQRGILVLPPDPTTWPGRAAGVAATLEGLLASRWISDPSDLVLAALAPALAGLDPAPLLELMDARNSAHVDEASPTVDAQESSAPIGPVVPIPAVSTPPREAPYGRRSDDFSADRGVAVLKVAQEKVDQLMDLIGELVVAKNSLPYLAVRAENDFGVRELARLIKNQYAVINRIAEEMQDAIMQVRMLPVGTVLQRFPRLVRDLSRKLGKQVDLVLEGEDTECDKNIIEALADPLVHVLRNSLDHGIETPDERVTAGKPGNGTIRIRAFQEGDRVVLEVSDDGRGVDPVVVKRKAFEKGLIDEERLESLSDADAVQLIFLPGFSTAAEISDVSGRGVGMDAVRSAIGKVNGEVSFHSDKGSGTALRITLPLSMAVTSVMMVETRGQTFGVPMDLVVETVRVPASDVRTFKRQKTVSLRGRVVPLMDLNHLLGIEEEQVRNEEGEFAVLVVRLHGENVGLVVDDFHETLDIILKPLDGPLATLRGYSGTALLGNGSVLMVLDPKELV